MSPDALPHAFQHALLRDAMLIQVQDDIFIDERDISLRFVRASGPGGQNVNRVASAVQLRFNLAQSELPNAVRQRLTKLARRRINDKGELVIDARRFRTQERNRQDAMARLIELIRKACEKPKTRRKTKPTRTAREKRLSNKRKRSDLKKSRRFVAGED